MRPPAIRLLAACLLAAPLLLTACSDDDDPVIVGPGDRDPEIVDARSLWVEEGWEGRDPIGTPAVQLMWTLPDDWSEEVFRVYSRASGGGNYRLIATVTSCRDRSCLYTDTNVARGQSYDYFVATVDERRNVEVGESAPVSVRVPDAAPPAVPGGLRAIALDGGAFILWDGVGAARYRVFLLEADGEDLFVEVGATDGIGYVDTRAENGSLHAYAVAAVGHPDEGGYVGRLSETVSVIPRPDYHAELIFTHQDDPTQSGFRFRTTGDDSPIVSGSAADAQWRLEASPDGPVIVPLGSTLVTGGIFTTDLSCGPGSESDCEYVAQAPAAAAFGSGPVPVFTGNSYVFQVQVSGQTHYGKIRVQGDGVDGEGNHLVVFDWAYQMVPGEPSLNQQPLGR